MRLPCLVMCKLWYKFVNTTGASKTKEFWFQLVLWWWRNVARDRRRGARVWRWSIITWLLPLFMHNNVCRACFSALNYYTKVYKSLRNKISVQLRNSSFGFTAMNWCPPGWTNVISGNIILTASFSARFLIDASLIHTIIRCTDKWEINVNVGMTPYVNMCMVAWMSVISFFKPKYLPFVFSVTLPVGCDYTQLVCGHNTPCSRLTPDMTLWADSTYSWHDSVSGLYLLLTLWADSTYSWHDSVSGLYLLLTWLCERTLLTPDMTLWADSTYSWHDSVSGLYLLLTWLCEWTLLTPDMTLWADSTYSWHDSERTLLTPDMTLWVDSTYSWHDSVSGLYLLLTWLCERTLLTPDMTLWADSTYCWHDSVGGLYLLLTWLCGWTLLTPDMTLWVDSTYSWHDSVSGLYLLLTWLCGWTLLTPDITLWVVYLLLTWLCEWSTYSWHDSVSGLYLLLTWLCEWTLLTPDMTLWADSTYSWHDSVSGLYLLLTWLCE